MRGLFLQREKPLTLSSSTTFYSILLRPSEERKKRYKERGSPCLIPRDGLMSPFGSPLTNIEYDTCVFIGPLQDGPWAKDWR